MVSFKGGAWPDRVGETELVVNHSSFRNVGHQTANCAMCSWRHSGTQSAVTAAARRHVKANPTHEVRTKRLQEAKRATVLR